MAKSPSAIPPASAALQNVARKAGLLDLVEETGIDFAPFEESVKIRPTGTTFHELEVARDLLEADVIINLPKLKTHQMMGLTCAVKKYVRRRCRPAQTETSPAGRQRQGLFSP